MKNTLVHTLSALALIVGASSAHAVSYGVNLVVDGDAENADAGMAWTTDGTRPLFEAAEYGPNWVQIDQPGPADRGFLLFVGGSGLANPYGYQVVSVAANATNIDAGRVNYDQTGWLGGWLAQTDASKFSVTFLGAANEVLGSSTLGPLAPADRNNETGLFLLAKGGVVPTLTRSVKFELEMNRFNGGDNDGYADNLSFVMTSAPVPEPETYALFAAGLGLLGFVARRRKA